MHDIPPLLDEEIAQFLQHSVAINVASGSSGDFPYVTRALGCRVDYPGVVGLPLRLLVALLAGAGIQVPVDIDALYREKPYPNWTRFAHD